MSNTTLDPSVLRALAEYDEIHEDEMYAPAKSIAQHLKESGVDDKKLENVEIVPDNPAYLKILEATLSVALERSNNDDTQSVEYAWSFDFLLNALRDITLSAETKVLVSDAITSVPLYDETISDPERHKSNDVYQACFQHASLMAQKHLQNEMSAVRDKTDTK